VSQKTGYFSFPICSENVDGFPTFLHRSTQRWICSTAIIKDRTTS